jgi:hypothetical protein
VRLFFAVLVAAAALGASLVSAAVTPTYTVTFTGTGSEHQLDQKQNIEDDGTCNAAEHVDVTATLAWSSSWLRFNPAGRSPVGRPAQIAGSRAVGTHVKDACGLPLTDAPDGWVSQQSCDAELVATGSPQLSLVKKTATTLVLAIAAPPFAVPVGVQCPLNVRNDQLGVHVVVPLKKLRALKKGRSLTFAVGTARPGPGDVYAPALDCSQPTKPYLGYRTADHCQDTLSWSGSVSITRA